MSMKLPAIAVAVLVAVGLVGCEPLAGAGHRPARGRPPWRRPACPPGVPPAATRAEPVLPVPAGWPFPDRFPRTSGTSRLAGGAVEWTDFLYDDHGAIGAGTPGGGDRPRAAEGHLHVPGRAGPEQRCRPLPRRHRPERRGRRTGGSTGPRSTTRASRSPRSPSTATARPPPGSPPGAPAPACGRPASTTCSSCRAAARGSSMRSPAAARRGARRGHRRPSGHPGDGVVRGQGARRRCCRPAPPAVDGAGRGGPGRARRRDLRARRCPSTARCPVSRPSTTSASAAPARRRRSSTSGWRARRPRPSPPVT